MLLRAYTKRLRSGSNFGLGFGVGGLGRHPPRRRFVDVPSVIQTCLISFKGATGLPWWATFACSTVFVRAAMFPLVYRQILASRTLAGAVPELNFLFQLLRQRLRTIPVRHTAEQLRVVTIFFKGVGACVKLHGVSPLQIISSPLANMAVFVTFVYSLRGLIVGGGGDGADLGLTTGGMLWFHDLTLKDGAFLLPLTALTVSYSAIELAFRTPAVGGAARFTLLLKDAFQSLLLVSLPFMLPLPAGVFCYWIPSSLCGVAQTLALRNLRIQRLLRIEPKAKPPAHLTGLSSSTTSKEGI